MKMAEMQVERSVICQGLSLEHDLNVIHERKGKHLCMGDSGGRSLTDPGSDT